MYTYCLVWFLLLYFIYLNFPLGWGLGGFKYVCTRQSPSNKVRYEVEIKIEISQNEA